MNFTLAKTSETVTSDKEKKSANSRKQMHFIWFHFPFRTLLISGKKAFSIQSFQTKFLLNGWILLESHIPCKFSTSNLVPYYFEIQIPAFKWIHFKSYNLENLEDRHMYRVVYPPNKENFNHVLLSPMHKII